MTILLVSAERCRLLGWFDTASNSSALEFSRSADEDADGNRYGTPFVSLVSANPSNLNLASQSSVRKGTLETVQSSFIDQTKCLSFDIA